MGARVEPHPVLDLELSLQAMMPISHHIPLMEPDRLHALTLGMNGVDVHVSEGVADVELDPRAVLVLVVAVQASLGQISTIRC